MRFIAWLFLAAISAAFVAPRAPAADRPRYGGTLRIETRAALLALDPAQWPANPAQAALEEKLLMLVSDRLVCLEATGRPQAALAQTWQSSADGKLWKFTLRAGVKFQDGTLLTPAIVAAALQALHASWRVSAIGSGVEIAADVAVPGMLYELAAARNSIFRRSDSGAWLATGPFRIAAWQPAQRVVLAANEDYWAGRPFLDSVEIVMGRSPRDQLIDLALGDADVVELLPDQMRRATESGARAWASKPVELFALVFERRRPAVADARVRQAVLLGIDRAAMRGVLLQKQGEPAGGLLPQWLSGYAFLFSTAIDPARALRLWSELKPAPSPALVYDAADPLARALAERVVVNARAAGIALHARAEAPGAAADLRLVRLRVDSVEAQSALAALATALGMGDSLHLAASAGPEQLYAAERSLLDGNWVIPLVALPEIYGLSAQVKDWIAAPVPAGGGWRLEEAWVERESK